MLFLSGNNFIGEIGSDISALKLQELDLSINKLTGSIPEDIVNLKNLKILYLYYNNLVGQIPSGVGMLPNLTDLRLFSNRVFLAHSLQSLENIQNWNIFRCPTTTCPVSYLIRSASTESSLTLWCSTIASLCRIEHK